MHPKPIKHYRKPGYPTRLAVLSDPDLLKRNLPPGWRAIPGMAGSVALFLAANATVHAADKKAGAPSASVAVVAPIFDHGEGRGVTGCVVVAPPVFLSEEEAWQVIDEELSRRGVKLPESAVQLRGVQIPRRIREFKVNDQRKVEEKITEREGSEKPFTADRADSRKHVAVEFVSAHDYGKVGGPFSMSTVQSYDFKEAAKNLAEDVRKKAKDKVYLGLLYDPATNFALEEMKQAQLKTPEERQKWRKEGWAEANRKSEAESKRLLRLQVQDFLKWLEAQGAI